MKYDSPDSLQRDVRQAFDQVQATEEQKVRTREQVLARMRAAQDAPAPAQIISFNRRRSRVRRFLPVAACLVLVVLALGGWTWMHPVASIAFDVNPSLELNVNCFDRVVSVDTYNAAGEQLAQEAQVEFKSYEDALNELLETATVKSLVEDGGEVDITVATSDDATATKLMAGVERCSAEHSSTTCHRATSEEAEAAHHEGMSVGRWRVYQDLLANGVDISADEINSMSMHELHDMQDDQTSSTHGHQNGYQSSSASSTSEEDDGQHTQQSQEMRGTHEQRHQGNRRSQEHS